MQDTLSQDFPHWAKRILALRLLDSDFARLCASYDEISLLVHRAELRIDQMTEPQEAGLRRSRARLKDQVLIALAHAQRGR